jgi:hypothetical protein
MVRRAHVSLVVIIVVVVVHDGCTRLFHLGQELIVLLQLGHDLINLNIVRRVFHLHPWEHKGGVAADATHTTAAVALELGHLQDEILMALVLDTPLGLQLSDGGLQLVDDLSLLLGGHLLHLTLLPLQAFQGLVMKTIFMI